MVIIDGEALGLTEIWGDGRWMRERGRWAERVVGMDGWMGGLRICCGFGSVKLDRGPSSHMLEFLDS